MLELNTSEAPDLGIAGTRQLIAKQILADIDDYCAEAYDDGHRNHLGASLIGDDCARKLYYSFRWAKHEKFSGRMQRLFNRGHREEERFVEWLRGIGFQVWEVTPEGNQHRIKAVQGHFGGSLDGVGVTPDKYKINEPLLLEFKTNGTGAAFTKLKEKGVAVAKPQHFAQMSVYGKEYKFKYALYICINKNDDDLHVEVVKLDWNLAEMLIRKAEDIITADIAPNRIAQNAAFFECKFCTFSGICHNGEAPEKNCRSCVNSKPVENSEWFCKIHSANIPKEFIKQGCNQYHAIT